MIIGIAVAVVALVLALSFIIPNRLLSSGNDHTFHPSGNARAWLDERYAGGVGAPWEVPQDENQLGISADGRVLATGHFDWDVGGVVIGRDLQNGSELWRIEGVDCGPWANTRDGQLVCMRDDDKIVVVDLDSASESLVHTGAEIPALRFVGRYQDLLIVRIDLAAGIRILALPSDGTIAWEAAFADYPDDCWVTGDHVVCAPISSGAFGAFDAATGAVTLPLSNLTGREAFVAGSEGYLVQADIMDGEPKPMYDFNGTKIATVEPYAPEFPSDSENVFYSTEDFEAGGLGVVAVTADGRVVAEYGEGFGGYRITATKTERENYLHSVSASGTVFLESDVVGYDPLLINEDGDVVADLSAYDLDMYLLDGIIVGNTADWTPLIFPPLG